MATGESVGDDASTGAPGECLDLSGSVQQTHAVRIRTTTNQVQHLCNSSLNERADDNLDQPDRIWYT